MTREIFGLGVAVGVNVGSGVIVEVGGKVGGGVATSGDWQAINNIRIIEIIMSEFVFIVWILMG